MLVQRKPEFIPRRSTAKTPWSATEARQVLGHAAASGLSLAHYSPDFRSHREFPNSLRSL